MDFLYLKSKLSIPDPLKDVARSVHAGKLRRAKVRTLLSWFGHKRRRSSVVWTVRSALQELRLTTDPDFSTTDIDAFVRFVPVPATRTEDDGPSGKPDHQPAGSIGIKSTHRDPALYVGMLPAATSGVVTVTRDSTLSTAVTEMMYHNYSQLPVTQDMRRIDGMISWRSIGVARTTKENDDCKYVRDCIEKEFATVALDTPLLDAVEKIIRDEVVLVIGRDKRLTGIVTTSDLSLKYHELAAPFLLLQEIEDRLRLLIDDAFFTEEIAAAGDPRDQKREIKEASDLTFGEIVRLVEEDPNWKRLKLTLDRRVFVRLLRDVKDVRNEIMHFSPDDLSPENRDKIGKLRRLLEKLA